MYIVEYIVWINSKGCHIIQRDITSVVVTIIYYLVGHKLSLEELRDVEAEGEDEGGDDDTHHPCSGGVGDDKLSVEIRPRKNQFKSVFIYSRKV